MRHHAGVAVAVGAMLVLAGCGAVTGTAQRQPHGGAGAPAAGSPGTTGESTTATTDPTPDRTQASTGTTATEPASADRGAPSDPAGPRPAAGSGPLAAEFDGAQSVDPKDYPGTVTPVGFSSPSGNISCGFRDGTSAGAGVPGGVLCQIQDFTFRPGIDCHGRGPGGALTVGPSGPPRFHCAGDVESGGPTLAYGSAVTVGGVRCVSRTDGVTCLGVASGDGFRLARAAYLLEPAGSAGSPAGSGGAPDPAPGVPAPGAPAPGAPAPGGSSSAPGSGPVGSDPGTSSQVTTAASTAASTGPGPASSGAPGGPAGTTSAGSLVGRYFAGAGTFNLSGSDGNYYGVVFLDSNWAYWGRPTGGLPTCTAQTARVAADSDPGDGWGCLHYGYDAATGALRIGPWTGSYSHGGLTINGWSFRAVQIPAPGTTFEVNLVNRGYSGMCGPYGSCSTWTTGLLLASDGHFVLAKSSLTSIGTPGVGFGYGADFPPNEYGTYRVQQRARIVFTFADGTTTVRTIAVQLDKQGRPAPADAGGSGDGGLILDTDSFWRDDGD